MKKYAQFFFTLGGNHRHFHLLCLGSGRHLLQRAIVMKPTPPDSPWNTRYVHYAEAHGKTPEAMALYDDKQYPSGRMTGFFLWMSKMMKALHKVPPQFFFRETHGGIGNIVDFKAWDAFLEKNANANEIVTSADPLDNGLTPTKS